MDSISIIDITQENFNDYEEYIPSHVVEFMNEDLVYTYVALVDDKFAGVLSVFYDEYNSLLEIIDIYTIEDMRRNNIAFKMIEQVGMQIMEETDYSLRGIVASFSEANEEAKGFFEAIDFELISDENTSTFVYTLEDIKNSYLMENRYSLSDNYDLIRYKDMDNIKKKTLIKKIIENSGLYDMNFAEDLSEEYSISIWDGEEPVGTVEIICEDNGELSLGQFFVVKMDTAILGVMQKIVEELLEKYSLDTKFSVYIISESSRKLITKLLGDKCKKINTIEAVLNLVENEDAGEDFLDE